MTTNMNFTLSSGLVDVLKGLPNSYIYALQYAEGQFVAGSSILPLVSQGQIQSDNLSISLPTSFSSGQVYVLVQPNGDGTLASTISSLNGGNVIAISPANAEQYGFRYQLLEATLSGSSGDLGDVSSVNTFALPVSYSDSNGTRGFAPGFLGSAFKVALNQIAPGSLLSSGMSVAPAQGPNMTTNPWPSADWTAYVNALTNGSASATAALADMNIVSAFFGSPVQATAMLSQYGVSYNSTSGYFVLTPNTTNGATNTDWIRIKSSELLKSIYAQNGEIETSTDGGNTWTTSLTTTPNTADGAVVKYFVAGFDAGYWGGSGTSPNPYDDSVIDLNTTANWNYNYAYDATFNPAGSAITYSNTLGSGPGTAGGNNRFYDPWAQAVQSLSNSYGWSYGDLISQGGTNPQVSLYDATTNQQVQNINIKLFSDSEKLTAADGFVGLPPSYIAPTGPVTNGLPGYTPADTLPTTFNVNSIAFNFSFTVGSLIAPNGQTPAYFKFYAPGDKQAGADGFVSLELPILPGTVTANNNAPETSIWNILTVAGGPGNWSLADNAGPNPYSQLEGQFTIYNLPITGDSTAAWYQLVFGGTGAETTYNIYAKTDSNGAFLANGSDLDNFNFVVDHGLGYGSGNGINAGVAGSGSYTLSFAPSGVMTYNVETLSAPGTMFGTRGNDLLNGTTGNDTFNGAPGNDSINGLAGTDTAVSWEVARNFAVKASVGGAAITIQDKAGTDGTDSLTGIEKMQFRDITLDLTAVAKTAAQPATQIMKVVDLYTAGLNRAPDAMGLDYWVSRLADGASISDIAKAFFDSAEAAPVYSSSNSTPAFVNVAYQTATGRAPEAATTAFWVNELDTGHIQRTDFVTSLIANVRGTGGSATDAQYIANHEAVGAHFALTAGLNNVAWARAVESAVSGTAASVAAANAQTDAFAVVANTPGTSELVVQIMGVVP